MMYLVIMAWGPEFRVWLAKDDFDDHGERLQKNTGYPSP